MRIFFLCVPVCWLFFLFFRLATWKSNHFNSSQVILTFNTWWSDEILYFWCIFISSWSVQFNRRGFIFPSFGHKKCMHEKMLVRCCKKNCMKTHIRWSGRGYKRDIRRGKLNLLGAARINPLWPNYVKAKINHSQNTRKFNQQENYLSCRRFYYCSRP